MCMQAHSVLVYARVWVFQIGYHQATVRGSHPTSSQGQSARDTEQQE
jgi:hypothetical protein